MKRWMHRTIAVVVLAGTALAGAATAAHAGCRPDGVPNAAGTGVAGMIDDPVATPSKKTLYGEYGWGGYLWHTCDLGFGPDESADPSAMLDTESGNVGLRIASTLGATMTQLHAWTADPSAVTGPLDAVLEDTAQIVQDSTWGQWSPALILLAAALTIGQAVNGDVRRAMRTAGAILAAMFVIAWVLTPRPGGSVTIRTPDGVLTTQAGARSGAVDAARTFDGTVSAIVSGVDRSILHLPFMGSSSAVSADEARGATMADRVIYPLWARGALGTDDAVRQFGPELYAAGATKYGADTDADASKDRYESVANAVQDKDGSWYDTLRGKGHNRAGQGALAAVFMIAIAIIRVPAEALVLIGLIVMRLAVMFAPAFAALAILEFTRGYAKSVLKVVIASIVNVAVFGIIAAVHTGIVGAFIVNSPPIVALVGIAVVTGAVWVLSKPFRSATKLATAPDAGAAVEGVGSAPGRAWSHLSTMTSGGVGALGSYLGSRAARHEDTHGQEDRRPKAHGQEQWTRVHDHDLTRERPPALTHTGTGPSASLGRSISHAPRSGRRRHLAAGVETPPDTATRGSLPPAAPHPAEPTEATHTVASHPAGREHRTAERTPPALEGPNTDLFVPGTRTEPEAPTQTPPSGTSPLRLIEPEYDRDGVLTYDLFTPADGPATKATVNA